MYCRSSSCAGSFRPPCRSSAKRSGKGKATEAGGPSTDTYSWILARITRGVGAKKRKVLANCLIEAWRECEAGPDTARIGMRELYKRGSRLGTTASAVGVELKAMAKAGLVILKHDAVYCGVQEPTASGGTSAATDSGGTSNSEAVAPIETSAAQPSSSPPEEPDTDHVDEEAPRAEVWRVLVELFSVSRNEMVSLHVLRQRIQSQISTEEIIAVLKELEGDGYIMYRDEEGALDGPAVHRIDDDM